MRFPKVFQRLSLRMAPTAKLGRRSRSRPMAAFGTLLITSVATLLSGCNGGSSGPVATAWSQDKQCTQSVVAAAFAQNSNVKVVTVHAFNVGDPLTLDTVTASTLKTTVQVCGVQLLVGPGSPGPAGAPSTSTGIGIRVFLPTQANWNNRLHVLGEGGWGGSLDGNGAVVQPLVTDEQVIQQEPAVIASTDIGNQSSSAGASFLMNPDGSINTTNWQNVSEAGIHQTAVQAKLLIQAYYGRPAKYSYYEGGSTGGRWGVKSAQAHPSDFNGIFAGYPSINWTKFLTVGVYPQVMFIQDLGGVPLSTAQEDLASNAAISACDVVGGQHLGYIPDPSQCRYNPAKDTSVLCVASGGTNASSACLTTAQAQVINKIWYGLTTDGSVPDPSVDNGWNVTPASTQLWYGQPRGTSLWGQYYVNVFGLPLSSPVAYSSPGGPFAVPVQQLALNLQNSSYADPTFVNATGNGANQWKTLDVAGLINAFNQGIALQSQFDGVNSDDPDLSAFNAAGGKMIVVHGLSDEVVPPQGSINYYNRVATQLGGMSTVESFFKLYLVPGMGHADSNGTANANAVIPIPSTYQPYTLLTNWVENGVEPGRADMTSPNGAASRPMCPYPQKGAYTSGSPLSTSSYTCQ